MTDQTTPVADGSNIGELIDGKFHSRALLKDPTGIDAMGVVTASPAPNTLLGRLKALYDAITMLISGNVFFSITPGADPLPIVPTAVYVTGAGTLVVKGTNDVAVTYSLDAKSQIAISPRYVLGASTATGIVGSR